MRDGVVFGVRSLGCCVSLERHARMSRIGWAFSVPDVVRWLDKCRVKGSLGFDMTLRQCAMYSLYRTSSSIQTHASSPSQWPARLLWHMFSQQSRQTNSGYEPQEHGHSVHMRPLWPNKAKPSYCVAKYG